MQLFLYCVVSWAGPDNTPVKNQRNELKGSGDKGEFLQLAGKMSREIQKLDALLILPSLSVTVVVTMGTGGERHGAIL